MRAMMTGVANKFKGGVAGPSGFFNSSDINHFNDNLTSVYKFESGSLDDVHGSFNSSSSANISTVTGKSGDAIDSAGNSYASFPSGAWIDSTSESYAFSVWVNHDGVSSTSGYVLAQYNDGANQSPFSVNLTPSSGALLVFMEGTGGGSSGHVNGNISASAWHHVFYAVDDNSVNIFIDGVLIDSATFTGTKLAGDICTIFARNFGTGVNSNIDGAAIDELYFWDNIIEWSTVTRQELATALYNSGSGDFYTA